MTEKRRDHDLAFREWQCICQWYVTSPFLHIGGVEITILVVSFQERSGVLSGIVTKDSEGGFCRIRISASLHRLEDICGLVWIELNRSVDGRQRAGSSGSVGGEFSVCYEPLLWWHCNEFGFDFVGGALLRVYCGGLSINSKQLFFWTIRKSWVALL